MSYYVIDHIRVLLQLIDAGFGERTIDLCKNPPVSGKLSPLNLTNLYQGVMEHLMRQVTQYSSTFKQSLLVKALTPNGPSAVELAKEFNIPYNTLYTWIKMSKKQNNKQVDAPALRPAEQSAEAKLHAVLETMGKTEQERGAYCRKHGFYTCHLDAWKKQILEGLSNTPVIDKKDKAERQQLTHENKKLKGELNRKNKALAEVSALLILKKKADLLWGVEEEL
jgi:transposase